MAPAEDDSTWKVSDKLTWTAPEPATPCERCGKKRGIHKCDDDYGLMQKLPCNNETPPAFKVTCKRLVCKDCMETVVGKKSQTLFDYGCKDCFPEYKA